MTRNDRRRGAFTLVELLVVIGVIAVLIALLIPAVVNMKQAAQSMKCLSNLRQTFVGIQVYGLENDGWHPVRGGNTAPGTGTVRTWPWYLISRYSLDFARRTTKTYVDRPISVCPSSRYAADDMKLNPLTGFDGAYGMYLHAGAALPFQRSVMVGTWSVTFQRLASAPRSAQTVFLADSLTMHNSNIPRHMYATIRANAESDYWGRIHMAHARGKRFNAAFYDGHAESLTDREANLSINIKLKYYYSYSAVKYNF